MINNLSKYKNNDLDIRYRNVIKNSDGKILYSEFKKVLHSDNKKFISENLNFEKFTMLCNLNRKLKNKDLF